MRVPLWTLVGLTTANSLTDGIPHGAREIMAQGMTVQFLEEVLSAGSLLGRRKRRQADDTCQDDNPNCNQYTTYCSNGQFLLVCKKTCGKCDGPSDPEPEKPTPSPQKNTSVTSSSSASNVSGCVDTMTYCEAMAMYCDNDDYKGVRMYCKKTCNSCNEDFSKYVDGTAPEADDGDGTSPTDDCTEMKYCSGFPFCAESELLKERMQDECPIVCKAEKCRDKWIDSVKPADTTGTTETDYDDCVDGSQSCPGVADLCNQAQYKETLSQYCRATCKLCTPSDNAPADNNKSTPGKCENQFENCDPMKFLCDDKENAYSERYRQMCPVTCGLCSPEAASGTSPTATAPKQEAPSGCQDSANNCGTLLEYCTGAETKEMMQIQCKKSCGFCDAGPPAVETCEDDPAINCGSFLAYCINKNTDVPKKCRKSCGLCPGMTPVTPAPAVVTTRAPTTVATTKAVVTMAPASAAKEPASSTECKVPTADKMKGCAKYKKFCKAKKYEKKLSSQCAMTCNVCVPIGGSAPATKAPAAAGAAAGGASAASGECRDGTPKQCPQLKRYCKVGKYKTMMMKKCKATCGFCGAAAGSGAGTAPAPKTPPAKTPASGEKYGEWSNWSKCDPKSCRQYKRRNCLQQPCAKPDLYNIQKCPADQYPNIAKCQAPKAPAANTAPVCKDRSPQCTRYKGRCGNAQVSKQCPKTCGKCASSRRRRSSLFLSNGKIYKAQKPTARLEGINEAPVMRSTFEICEDTIGQCGIFLKAGFCQKTDERTVNTMKTKCAKTCGHCKTGLPHAYWSQWSDFNQCSRTCAGGIQERRRTCPQPGRCVGKDKEQKICNMSPCVSTTIATTIATTQAPVQSGCVDKKPDRCQDWLRNNQLKCSSFSVRALCKRTCGGCSSNKRTPTVSSITSPWGIWTACSGSCRAGFYRNRARTCLRGDCQESLAEREVCDIGVDCGYNRGFECNDKDTVCPEYAKEGKCWNKYQGDWMRKNCPASCRTCPGLKQCDWSEWSNCSVSCGSGKKTRNRCGVIEQADCYTPAAECAAAKQSKECVDKHIYCPKLQAKCTTEQVVWNACQKTCNSCTEEEAPKCNDRDPDFCLQMLGRPTRTTPEKCNREDYRFACKATCRACDDEAIEETEEEEEECIDISAVCSKETIRSQCSTNNWINVNCKRSCGTCGGVKPTEPPKEVCEDKMDNCENMKSICDSQDLVREKCPLTCGTCVPATIAPTKEPITTASTTATTKIDQPLNCMDNPICDRYKSSWELNCRDSEQFREACPSLCRRAECEEFWPVIEEENLNKPFKAWGTWSRCSKSCGGGERSRTRECKAPKHNPCSEGDLIEHQICSKEACDQGIGPTLSPDSCVDLDYCEDLGATHCSDPHVKTACPKMCDNCPAQWLEWSEWTECSSSCKGAGFVTRSRECDGENCVGESQEQKECEGLEYCFGEWSDYTTCKLIDENNSCGNGTQYRKRVCETPADCDEVETEVIDCTVDCLWSEWSDYSDCSVSCGVGNMTRTRFCPQEDECEGDSEEITECSLPQCCEYLEWDEWSECTVSCDKGTQTRKRGCVEGCDCNEFGPAAETRPCNMQECPMQATWAEWEELSPCSQTCGGGFQTTRRQCVNGTIGVDDGCNINEYLKIQACGTESCLQWSEWSGCSSDCGWGTKSRSRGEDREELECWSGVCSNVGVWSNWGQFVEPCPKVCGGYQLRKRHCLNGIPGRGGCPGTSEDKVSCTPCGEWAVWGAWSECSKTCGEPDNHGITTRRRACENGICQFGEAEQIESCNTNIKCRDQPRSTRRPVTTTTRRPTTTTTEETTVETTTTTTTYKPSTTSTEVDTSTSSESVAPIPSIENIALSSGALPPQIEDTDDTEIIEGFSDVAPLPFEVVEDVEESNDYVAPIPNKMGNIPTSSIFDPIGDDDSETDLFSGDYLLEIEP